MKSLFPVFKFEFKNRISQKSIKYTTIIFSLLFLFITFIPRFVDIPSFLQNIGSSENNGGAVQLNDIGFFIEDENIDENIIKNILSFANPISFDSEKKLYDAIDNGELEYGYIFQSMNSFTEISEKSSLFSQNYILVQEGLSTALRNKQLILDGINPELVDKASIQEITFNQISLGKDSASGFLFSYIGMFVSYFIILLFGNSVATLVAREKNDRTMEILITTTTAKSLIVGKVFASTLLSFLQIFIMILATVIGFILNKDYYPEIIIDLIRKGIKIDSIIMFIVFLVLGSLMYFFLYAAFGSLVSKVEEVNNATMPIQLFFVLGFLITSLTIQFPDSKALMIASIFPFTSPISFFVRYNMTSIPIYQTILAIALLGLSAIFFAFISIKIYRMGTLNYGNKMSFLKTVKTILKREN